MATVTTSVNSVVSSLTAGAGVLGACVLIRTFIKMRSGRADPAPRLDGRTAIVTGSNTGILFFTIYYCFVRGRASSNDAILVT